MILILWIVLGIAVYIAIGAFIDRLSDENLDMAERSVAVITTWPLFLAVCIVVYPCWVWPRALAYTIRKWWDKQKNNKKEIMK